MPELYRAHGWRITMYADDHQPPHFHVQCQDGEAQIALHTLKLIAPPDQHVKKALIGDQSGPRMGRRSSRNTASRVEQTEPEEPAMTTPRISAIATASRSRLDVTWENGRTDRIDLGAHLARFAVLAPLKKADAFSRAKVGEWGWDVTWGDDLEIAASTLARLAREQSGSAMPNVEFRAWMERNGLSLSDAAEALGLTRRTITYYSSGARPIPRYIALACKGWEAEQRRAA